MKKVIVILLTFLFLQVVQAQYYSCSSGTYSCNRCRPLTQFIGTVIMGNIYVSSNCELLCWYTTSGWGANSVVLVNGGSCSGGVIPHYRASSQRGASGASYYALFSFQISFQPLGDIPYLSYKSDMYNTWMWGTDIHHTCLTGC